MSKTNEIGYFAPIETLAEYKTVRDILDSKGKINDHFTEVECVMKKIVIKAKDGTSYEPRYSLKVILHPSIEEEINNKKMVNATEFSLLCYEFLKPLDSTELRFRGKLRFLRGESEKIDREDKSFVVVELFISENLSPISAYLNNGTKLLIERLTKLQPEDLAKMKTVPFNPIKQFKLSSGQSNIVTEELAAGE